VTEAKRLEQQALERYVGHTLSTRAWDGWHLYLGIPATLVAAASGVVAVAGWPSSVAAFMSFAVAALSGAITFLDPKARTAEQYKAACGYNALWNEIRSFHKIECNLDSDINKSCQRLTNLRDTLTKLDEKTPPISGRAKKQAIDKIANGDYVAEVDRIGSDRKGATGTC